MDQLITANKAMNRYPPIRCNALARERDRADRAARELSKMVNTFAPARPTKTNPKETATTAVMLFSFL
jgi:hypothetical protein